MDEKMDDEAVDADKSSVWPSIVVASMTGFGMADYVGVDLNLHVEVRTVNSRFLDMVYKLPPVYSKFEIPLGDLMREYLRRGRVEIVIVRQVARGELTEIGLDEALFDAYLRCYEQAFSRAGLASAEHRELIVTEILRRKEITTAPKEIVDKTDAEFPHLKQAVADALNSLRMMRLREGATLVRELRRLYGEMQAIMAQMQEIAAELPAICGEKLARKVSQLGAENVEPQRLAQEVALSIEKADYTEEIARLSSHLAQFPIVLAEGGGRKLEFLLQEMGREVNTIGSKSQSGKLSELVIAAKAVLEKVREQIQNIE